MALLMLLMACGEKKNGSPQEGQTDEPSKPDQGIEEGSDVPPPEGSEAPDTGDGSLEEGSKVPPDDGSTEPDDPDHVEIISSQGAGYGDILRVKSTKEILFSPEIVELVELMVIGEDPDDYTAELLFILHDEEGNECYAYPKVRTSLHESNGVWFDLFLQGDGIDCGFCPTASRMYTIEMTLYKEERAVMMGTWQRITASAKYEQSPYYRPTALPTEEDLLKADCTVSFLVPETGGGTIEGECVQNLKGGQTTTKVTAIAAEGYLFAGWSDGYKEASREGESFIRDKAIYAKFTKLAIEDGIASMYIETDSGDPIRSKNQYVTATIGIVGAHEKKYNITVTTEIRGRGNSSFSSSASQDTYNSKNSYRLKLTEKVNLLGVGKAENRDWVLNANKFDASNLRNYFVWNLAKQMGSFPFVPNCTWVNLYINGDYRGIYMLTDHVEAAKDRVELDDDSTEPDKGYLVELDFRGADETDVVEGLDYFYVPGFYDPASGISNPREWLIKSEVTDTAQTDFIRDYIIQCHTAIMNGDRAAIDALVDIPSLIDMFILEELSKDVDAGGASMYMQKDTGGKLYFTAPWDFDFGFGTYGPATDTWKFVCETGGYDPNVWFAKLLTQEWFMKETYDRLLEISDMVELAKVGVRTTGELLEPAANRNDERWGIYGQKFHSYVSGQVSRSLYSYDEHIDFLCDWIDERYEWMVEEFEYRFEN